MNKEEQLQFIAKVYIAIKKTEEQVNEKANRPQVIKLALDSLDTFGYKIIKK